MPNPLSFFAAGKATLGAAKALLKVSSELDKVDLKMRIVELISDITELVGENTELHVQVMQSQKELADLKESLIVRDQLVHKDNSYWRKLPSGGEEGPFCTRCYDVDRILVRLLVMPGYRNCHNCTIKIHGKS